MFYLKKSLQKYQGIKRRWESVGCINGAKVIHDYAHHPTEISSTLKAARDLGYSKIVAVFQPFTFSRTALLKDDFIKALSIADEVILTPIMGSREVNTYGISSEDIAAGLDNCTCVKDFDEAVSVIKNIANVGDIVITMGGGDVYKIAHKISGK